MLTEHGYMTQRAPYDEAVLDYSDMVSMPNLARCLYTACTRASRALTVFVQP